MGRKQASSQTLIRRSAAAANLAAVPALYAPNPEAAKRFIEYFAANIRNVNTRRAYLHAVREFADWCALQRFNEIVDIEPLHVAAYIEQLTARLAKPSVKQHLAAIRMLFDWLVVGQVTATNPAAPVRGPKYTVKKGKTPVLSQDEARQLLDSIDVSTVVDLRDRALIATMIYTFGRVGAVGSACMKKAANGMRCRAIIISWHISTPISRLPESTMISRATCFAARVV
jgi:site-specific recombinase XerD